MSSDILVVSLPTAERRHHQNPSSSSSTCERKQWSTFSRRISLSHYQFYRCTAELVLAAPKRSRQSLTSLRSIKLALAVRSIISDIHFSCLVYVVSVLGFFNFAPDSSSSLSSVALPRFFAPSFGLLAFVSPLAMAAVGIPFWPSPYFFLIDSSACLLN